MKFSPRPTLPRLGAATLAVLTSLIPAAAVADSTIFQTTFATDTIHSATPAITPTGTNWYIMSSKNGTPSSVSGTGGLNLTYAATSNAAGVEGAARFTASPISLAAVGDSITARATFFTDNVRYLAVGLYDSHGVNPLTTLQNSGLSGTTYAGAITDGTLGWEGYRARAETALVAGNIATRPAQSGAVTQQAHDLVAPSSGDYNSPGPTSIGSVPASASPVTFADAYGAEYGLVYVITRTAADTLSISYTITDSADAVLYSVSGITTNPGTRPSSISSIFDAFAIGTRNNTPSGNTISTLTLTELTITANNADVARVVSQPFNQSWVTGQPGSITVATAGSGTLSYQWYKGTTAIPSATSATYTVASPSASDIGEYHVVVTNAFGSETSAKVNVDVVGSAAAPSFGTHPTTQTVNAGQTLTLTASASGSPTPTYQWSKFNGSTYVAISGATFPTYTIPATTPANAGTYRVTATNGSGAPSSNSAEVTIHTEAPAIVTPPATVAVNVGGSVTLNVTASGYPAPTYQWYKGTTLIPGATDATFTIAAATTPDAGAYHVIATNNIDSATSADATVTVNVIAPTITTEPANTTVSLGQPASFTVAASGSAPLSYQWYKGATPIDGATSATYTINPTTGSSGGDYHVVVNNESGTPATSATATLSLVVTETTPVFTTNFADDTINPMTVATEGNPSVPNPTVTPTSTSWYVLSSKTATNSRMLDDNPDTAAVADPAYEVTLNGSSGSAFFQTATRFSDTPISLAQVGTQLRLTTTFTARNVNTFGFGFYNSSGSWPVQLDLDTPALGVNNLILGSGATTAADRGTESWIGYRGTLSNLNGTNPSTSNVGHAMVTRPSQVLSTTNQGQELCVNGSGSISYNNPAGRNLTINTRTPASDALGSLTDLATFKLVFTLERSAADAYRFSYQIYSVSGDTETLFRAASGTADAPPSPPTNPLGNRPSDTTNSFDALAIGMRNGGPLNYPDLTPGPTPRFVFSNLKVEYSYPVAALYPSITDQPENATVAVGAPFTLTAAAVGSPTPTYQWWKNTGSGFAIIPGATSASYTVASASAADAATYKFVATNALGAVESDVVTVTVGSAASAYDTWASAKGLTVANNGASQDPDNDGVNNLLEFALGGDPLASSTAILPVATKSGSNLTFTFNVEVAATVDYTIGTESTTDLTATWTPVVHGVGGATIVETPVDADTDQVVVTVPATGARIFLRVEVAPKP